MYHVYLIGREEHEGFLHRCMMCCLTICWSGPAMRGILFLVWCIMLELVEFLLDVLGHRPTNCYVYVVPLQYESQKNCACPICGHRVKYLQVISEVLHILPFLYFTSKLSITRVKTMSLEACFHRAGVYHIGSQPKFAIFFQAIVGYFPCLLQDTHSFLNFDKYPDVVLNGDQLILINDLLRY